MDFNLDLKLDLNSPVDFRTSLKTNDGGLSVEEIVRRTDRAMKMNLPGIALLRRHTTPQAEAVVIGGGPSINDYVDTIRAFYEKGLRVYTTNKSHDWALEHGIKPYAHVILDSNDWVAGYVKNPQRDVRYLVAGQCHDDTFNALKDYPVFLWHGGVGDSDTEAVEPLTFLEKNYPHDPWTVLPGGTTVGIRCPLVCWASTHAYRIHMFGMDSSYRDGKAHAYAKENRYALMPYEVGLTNASGHKAWFTTNRHMARQAADFEQMVENELPKLVKDGRAPPFQFKFYGDGLLPTLAAMYGWNADPEINRKWTTKAPLPSYTIEMATTERTAA